MITYGTESIDFQGDRFFKNLVEVITRLKVGGEFTTEAINNSGFSNVVKDFTGMVVKLNIVPDSGAPNAYAMIPDFDVNHPFVKPLLQKSSSTRRAGDALNVLEMLGNEIRGGIDLKGGKVTGFYSKLPLDVFVTTGLLNMAVVRAEHIAAIIIHEIGHLFTYFEFLGTVAFGSLVVGATAKAVMELNSSDERRDVIRRGQDLLGVDASNADDLESMSENPENVHVILLKNYMSQLYINGNLTPYDYRNIEQAADAFAAKHGAGTALADYVVILGRASFDKATMSRALFMFAEIGRAVFNTLKGFGAPADGILSLYLSAPGVKLYDDPEARIRFIRQQLTASVGDVDGIDKQKVMRDVEVIDSILGRVKDKRDLLTIFWESIPSGARSRRRQEQAAKQLESILYNDLAYQAERISDTATINNY